MKRRIVMLVMCVCAVLLFAGCEEFFAGAAAYEAIALKTQEDFISAVAELNQTTAELEDGVNLIDGKILIKPETIEAMKALKGREKDPLTWVALASMLANAFWGGTAVKKRVTP